MRNRPAAAKPLALLAALLLLGGLLTACGDDGGDDAAATGGSGATSTTAKAGDAGDEITITAKDFSLTSVTAKAGEDVYVDNQGPSTHTVTSDQAGAFDTGNIAAGKQAELTAPTAPGTYAFHCTIHPNMTGTLTVTA